jgi:hypothetical protein
VGQVAGMGETINEYRSFVGKPRTNTPLGRPRNRWENTKMAIRYYDGK